MLTTPHFAPIRILEVDIAQPAPDILAETAENGQIYDRALVFVRLHGQPMGMVDLSLNNGALPAADCTAAIWLALHEEINTHLRQDGFMEVDALTADGLPPATRPQCLQARAALLSEAPFVSVIVATRERADSLKLCLDALVALDYPPGYDIVVVDNAPQTPATAELVQQYDNRQVRYIREDVPGVSRARNRALAEVTAEIVAFTDDDVLVDADWLTGIVQGFRAADNVACVNGLVIPAELEQPAQVWFEEYGGFNRGYQRRIYDLEEHHPQRPLYPYSAGIFGTGASMAFKTAVLRDMGGFDPVFGTGSKARGGPDLEAYFQVIIKGYQLVYEPSSVVYHIHRRNYAKLRRQVFSYGCGFTAYITKWLLKEPRRILDILSGMPYGLFMLLNPRSAKQRQKRAGYPKELTRLELLGMVYGPLAFVHSWWHERRISAAQAHLVRPV